MKQMYKVFIENTPVFILDYKEFNSSKGILILEENIKTIKNLLFDWISINKNNTPIFIFSNDPQKVFIKIFKDYDYVQASGGIVKSKKGYLFIKRNGVWDIPKGKIEKNETPEIGAVREIEEECGISKPILKNLICKTYHTYEFKGKPTIKETYWFSLNYKGKEKPTGQIEEGITKVKWIKKQDLNKIKKNTFPSIIDVLSNYFN